MSFIFSVFQMAVSLLGSRVGVLMTRASCELLLMCAKPCSSLCFSGLCIESLSTLTFGKDPLKYPLISVHLERALLTPFSTSGYLHGLSVLRTQTSFWAAVLCRDTWCHHAFLGPILPSHDFSWELGLPPW